MADRALLSGYARYDCVAHESIALCNQAKWFLWSLNFKCKPIFVKLNPNCFIVILSSQIDEWVLDQYLAEICQWVIKWEPFWINPVHCVHWIISTWVLNFTVMSPECHGVSDYWDWIWHICMNGPLDTPDLLVILVNISLGNGLLWDSAKPSSVPLLTDHVITIHLITFFVEILLVILIEIYLKTNS